MLQIEKGSSLKDIQKQFNTYYPFLKIEFFKASPVGEPLYKTSLFTAADLVKYVDGAENKVLQIDVSRKRKVSEVEKDFEKLLGVSAHVYRKSGNVWVEATLTNDWPLGEQNEEGRLISSHFTKNKPGQEK